MQSSPTIETTTMPDHAGTELAGGWLAVLASWAAYVAAHSMETLGGAVLLASFCLTVLQMALTWRKLKEPIARVGQRLTGFDNLDEFPEIERHSPAARSTRNYPEM